MRRAPRRLVLAAVLAAVPVLATACNTDDGPPVKLSADGKAGRELAQANGCAACHTEDGSASTGPTWRGLFGSTVTLQNGRKVTADADYIVRSVRDPNAERPKDAGGQMPTFDEDRVTDEQLAKIVAYIEDLGRSAGE